MRIIRKYAFVSLCALLSAALPNFRAAAQELIIGEKRVAPGIIYIFEGAIKDEIAPAGLHLSEGQTHVHIEARVNWDKKNIPAGAVPGGFVPYLMITVQITHEKTNRTILVDLVPHINLVDNFHYARNLALPGDIGDLYTLRWTILPPNPKELALHKDWVDQYGYALMKKQSFTYRRVNFEEIARAQRR